MSSLTLYWALASQPGRAVKTLIDIGKIPCTFIDVNILARQQRSKEYLQMYPVGKIPVLKDGDFSLGESGAIMIYLCELYPHIAHLYGKTIQQRAIVNQYLSWYQSVFRPAMFRVLRLLIGALLFKQKVPQFHLNALIAQMIERINNFNEILATNKTKFVAGDNISIADLLFYYEMTNLPLFDMDMEKWPQIKKWFSEIYKVPEVKAITHQHYQFSKGFKKMIDSIEIVKSKPKL